MGSTNRFSYDRHCDFAIYLYSSGRFYSEVSRATYKNVDFRYNKPSRLQGKEHNCFTTRQFRKIDPSNCNVMMLSAHPRLLKNCAGQVEFTTVQLHDPVSYSIHARHSGQGHSLETIRAIQSHNICRRQSTQYSPHEAMCMRPSTQ